MNDLMNLLKERRILPKAHFGGNSGRDPDGGAVRVQRGE